MYISEMASNISAEMKDDNVVYNYYEQYLTNQSTKRGKSV